MTFREIPQGWGAAPKVKPEQVVLVARRNPKDGSRRNYRVLIGAGLAARLRWSDRDALSVQWGEGEDRGRLRLVPSDGAPRHAALSEKTGVVTVALGGLPPDCAHADFDHATLTYTTQPCGGASESRQRIVLTLPDGFFGAVRVEGAGA